MLRRAWLMAYLIAVLATGWVDGTGQTGGSQPASGAQAATLPSHSSSSCSPISLPPQEVSRIAGRTSMAMATSTSSSASDKEWRTACTAMTTARSSDVAAELGVADLNDTRAAAWGDFDGDGDIDLFVGFTRKTEIPSKLYRNEGAGKPFVDVAKAMGIEAPGETRQSSFIDFDNDGDLDFFVGLRDAPNMLFRNDGKSFTSVGKEMGIDDPRRTVGAVWFDMDQDGDLDVFVANQNGDLNGLFRNDGARFVDVAKELGMDAAGRPQTSGSNGPSVADYDNDGDFDLFVAGYGGNFLYRNDGPGKFTEVAAQMNVAGGALATPSRWGDFDNDGRIDLYVSSYIDKPINERDFLFHNEGSRFTDVIPENIAKRGATHGIQWVDFDKDGDLDFAFANNNPNGTHSLYRNLLPSEQARRSIQVLVQDARGRATRAGV